MPKGNRTRYVVLGLLEEEPRTGYDIKKAIEEAIGHFWHESYGQIYPTLKVLADEGLVEVASEGTGGRRRRVYRITEAGRKALASWLEEPPAPQPPRNELLLKLFFGRSTRPEVLIDHIRAFRDEVRTLERTFRLVEAQFDAEEGDDAESLYVRLTLLCGLHLVKARLAWAAEALAALEDLRDR